jgi:hypothetical protein
LRARHAIEPPRIDSATFRPGWLRQTRIDVLLTQGAITRDAHDAACRFRGWCEAVGAIGAHAWDAAVDCARNTSDAAAIARVTQARKLREVAAAIGEVRVRIIIALVVDEASFRQIAAALSVDDHTGKARAIDAIEALADFLAGRQVAPAPITRTRIAPGRG